MVGTFLLSVTTVDKRKVGISYVNGVLSIPAQAAQWSGMTNIAIVKKYTTFFHRQKVFVQAVTHHLKLDGLVHTVQSVFALTAQTTNLPLSNDFDWF